MKIAIVTPPNYDFLIMNIIEGLIDLGHYVVTSSKLNKGLYLKRNDFIDFSNSADLFVISSGSYCDYSVLKYISNNKTVFVDGSDLPTIHSSFNYPVNLVFKRELLNSISIPLVFPLPFAAENRYFKDFILEGSRSKITFISTLNNFMRRSIKEFLIFNFKKNDIFVGTTGERSYNGISGEFVPTPIYNDLLRKSIVSISVPGKGWDCARFWEIIASKTCLITQKNEIQIPNPFISGEHIFEFSNLEELSNKIEYCLKNPQKANEMALKAYDHLLKFHTSKARAIYLLDAINENLKIDTFFQFELSGNNKSWFFYYFKYLAYKTWKNVSSRFKFFNLLISQE